MRQPQNNLTISPAPVPHHAVSEDRLATSGSGGARRRADASQRRARSAAARARIARLISGPIPVALAALQGLLTIALAGPAGRGYTHRLLLTVVLAENVVALLSRHRHPLLALAAISLTYATVDYLPTTLPALLLALLTVRIPADSRIGRVAVGIAAVVLIASPAIHGDVSGIG
jgi:hypothetical protein